MPSPVTATLPPLPLLGRGADLAALASDLDAAAAGRGGTVVLTGAAGVGKSRLLRTLADEAARRGWAVASGRAYPVETGVPFALFSDAFLPVLRRLEADTRAVLTRGGEAELAFLFPGLGPGPGGVSGDAAEFKTRLFWNFSQFVLRLADRQPLLIVLDDVHWADASSLELLHFSARQVQSHAVLIVCSWNDEEREKNAALRNLERSLIGAGVARAQRVEPLTLAQTAELVERVFDVSPAVSQEFAALLYGWTRGNPFFLEETLKSLIESGRLYQSSGTWVGWEVRQLDLPGSVRDAIAARIERLSAAARAVAEVAAVVGARTRYEVLRVLASLDQQALLAALDELRSHHVLDEKTGDRGEILYDFVHPLVRETLYGGIGRARARTLHTTVAQALERHWGERALEHASELAYHYARGDTSQVGDKAVQYLAVAGRDALARQANGEAASYLSAALELADAQGGGAAAEELAEDLAQARARLGDHQAAARLWQRALIAARAAGDAGGCARVLRRLGLVEYWSGRHTAALERFDEALPEARSAGDAGVEVRIQLSRGMALQELGRADEAEAAVRRALELAESLEDTALLARVQRMLLFLYTWTGPPELAREHGARAISLAVACKDRVAEFAAHWATAVMAGLTGNAADVTTHLAECRRLADALGSPRLQIAAAEIEIEYAHATGDWDSAIAIAERTIAVARALGQRALLPRVLVWAALVYFGRDDMERGLAYVEEAWALSGAGDAASGKWPVDVHTVVPAHLGRAAYHAARGEFAEAVRIGEAGVAIADRTGYVVWAIHRLLPVVAESYLAMFDREGARRTGERLRRDSQRMGHSLGLAWADASDALVDWIEGDLERALVTLRQAAEALEAVPFVPDAARIRRQLAARLRDAGEEDAAVRELRDVHDVFTQLGAARELAKTREQMRELGTRPPARTAGAGVEGLTGREVEIIRLVAARKSNKAIGKALGISPRTVSTHLSNIFRKLELGSRGELTDFARRMELPD